MLYSRFNDLLNVFMYIDVLPNEVIDSFLQCSVLRKDCQHNYMCIINIVSLIR